VFVAQWALIPSERGDPSLGVFEINSVKDPVPADRSEVIALSKRSSDMLIGQVRRWRGL
jgi:hypothetical protein